MGRFLFEGNRNELQEKKRPFFYYLLFSPLDKLKSGMGNNEILSNNACVKYSRPVTKCGKVQFVLARD